MIIDSQHKSFSAYLEELWISQELQHPLYTENSTRWLSGQYDDNAKKYENKSFIVLTDKKPIIAFIGYKTKSDKEKKLSFFDFPCISIQNKKLSKKEKILFLSEYDKIISDNKLNIFYRDMNIYDELSALSKHLLHKGAKPEPHFSVFINLKDKKEKLWNDLRKSYKGIINLAKKEVRQIKYDYKNISWDVMNDFKKLHYQEAGKETRTEKNWKIQLDMIKSKKAFLFTSYLNDILLGAAFFIYTKNDCYYASSAYNKNSSFKSVGHSIIWNAILEAKKLGCKRLETGDQFYFNFSNNYNSDSKNLKLSHFKSGFGGKTKTFLNLNLTK